MLSKSPLMISALGLLPASLHALPTNSVPRSVYGDKSSSHMRGTHILVDRDNVYTATNVSANADLCDFCPKQFQTGRQYWSICLVVDFVEDLQKSYGACYNGGHAHGEPIRYPENIKWPDEQYVAEAKEFLAYYTLDTNANQCADQSTVLDITHDLSSVQSDLYTTPFVSNANPAFVTYDILHGFNDMATNGGNLFPGIDVVTPNLASPDGWVVASVGRSSKAYQYSVRGKPMIFYAEDDPEYTLTHAAGCNSAEGPQWIDDSQGWASGTCSANFQQSTNPGPTYPAGSAIQLNDANGFLIGWTNYTAVPDAHTAVEVFSKLPYVYSFFTDLDANSLTWVYGAQSGNCDPPDFDQTTYRSGTCNFPC